MQGLKNGHRHITRRGELTSHLKLKSRVMFYITISKDVKSANTTLKNIVYAEEALGRFYLAD